MTFKGIILAGVSFWLYFENAYPQTSLSCVTVRVRQPSFHLANWGVHGETLKNVKKDHIKI